MLWCCDQLLGKIADFPDFAATLAPHQERLLLDPMKVDAFDIKAKVSHADRETESKIKSGLILAHNSSICDLFSVNTTRNGLDSTFSALMK